MNQTYLDTARLLTQVAPLVFVDDTFALKGGTAINREDAVETTAGRLLPSSSYSIRPTILVYEFTERMEGEEQGPGVLVSSTVDPYLQDYSVVASFALNCVCTPDVDLARRLTTGQRGLATRVAPQTLVR